MKTPTAVAEFLISGLRSFEQNILEMQNRLVKHTGIFIKDENFALTSLTQRLNFISIQLTVSLHSKIVGIEKDLRIHAKQFIQKNGSRLDNLAKVIRLLDPVNVLMRGYSVTYHKGNILKDASLLRKGDFIDTKLFDGVIKSIVDAVKEAEESEQEQENDLFSGTDRA